MTTENKVKQYTKNKVQEGYWVDARGVMTPE
ncbi:TPA: sulfate transporter, partial [Escherichia coli]|nr:sulfate transporter [Escherichia coli]